MYSSFGALFTGYFSGRFGRKPTLLASGVIYIIGSLIQSIVGIGMNQDVALSVLYFSRFLGGVGVGMVSALVPSYVSECVPKSIRGRCTGMIQLANNIGIMLSCTSLNFSVLLRFSSLSRVQIGLTIRVIRILHQGTCNGEFHSSYKWFPEFFSSS